MLDTEVNGTPADFGIGIPSKTELKLERQSLLNLLGNIRSLLFCFRNREQSVLIR